MAKVKVTKPAKVAKVQEEFKEGKLQSGSKEGGDASVPVPTLPRL